MRTGRNLRDGIESRCKVSAMRRIIRDGIILDSAILDSTARGDALAFLLPIRQTIA